MGDDSRPADALDAAGVRRRRDVLPDAPARKVDGNEVGLEIRGDQGNRARPAQVKARSKYERRRTEQELAAVHDFSTRGA
jgi:hypothetical protein